jgi:hypothetical protein
MTANRPSTARKVTPKTEADRTAALDEATSIRVDGVIYSVRLADIDGLVERDFRRETGLSVAGVLDQLASAPGIDSLAAFVWLAKLQADDKTTYEAELAKYNYGTEVDYAPEADAPAPEA